MTISPFVIGIDVAKHHLDGFEDGTGRSWRIANTPAAIAGALLGFAQKQPFFVFEASGSYDGALRLALENSGFAFARVNPSRARDFARATGQIAKTDTIDARVLAAMGRVLGLEPSATLNPEREKLQALNRRRDQLVDMRAIERTRKAEGCAPMDGLEAHIAWLTDEIKRLDALIAQHLAQSAELKASARLMRSLPGIGPVAATTLLALLPELGSRSPKTIAALAGLAPFNQDSGQSRGKRQIRGGRARVRRALYMAALAAVRTNARFKAVYQSILARSAAPKLALIAVARKLLVTLNAMLRTQVPFRP